MPLNPNYLYRYKGFVGVAILEGNERNYELRLDVEDSDVSANVPNGAHVTEVFLQACFVTLVENHLKSQNYWAEQDRQAIK